MMKMRETADPDPNDIQTADAAVDTFEALPLGQPFESAWREATTAVDALTQTAHRALFPPIGPAKTVDAIAAFKFAEELFERARYGDRVVDLHHACRPAHPELAAFLRSELVAARIVAAGADGGPAAVDRARLAIAGQLVGDVAFEPHAHVYAVVAPALAARVLAARARHTEHAAAELARIEREARAAADAIAAADRAEREQLAAYFSQHHGRPFVVGGHVVSGQALAAITRGAGGRDHDGAFVTFAIAELREARVRTEAADAAIHGHPGA
jgi:hypothetical protein